MSATLSEQRSASAANGEKPARGERLARPSPWRAAGALCWREIVRFFRQRNRVVGAIGQPLLFWLLFGAGLQRSFRMGESEAAGTTFLEYYFPGSLMLILLFTAIFATISIIEDRREGLLQAVLIAPSPRWSMVLGIVLGGTLIALVQGLIFLALALLLMKTAVSAASAALLIVLMFVAAAGLTSLGVVLAWRMESTQGFHAIMSLLLMPMWLLSGAFFPVPALTGEATWSEAALHWVMRLNPLTYAVAGARQLVYSGPLPAQYWTPSLVSCWLVTCGFAVAMFAAAWWIAGQRTRGDAI
jgi:ABC-2 type transport system permease protein